MWLRDRVTLSNSEMKLDDLHQFITENCPVDLQGRKLNRQDTLSFIQDVLPRAVPVTDQATDDQLYPIFKFNNYHLC